MRSVTLRHSPTARSPARTTLLILCCSASVKMDGRIFGIESSSRKNGKSSGRFYLKQLSTTQTCRLCCNLLYDSTLTYSPTLLLLRRQRSRCSFATSESTCTIILTTVTSQALAELLLALRPRRDPRADQRSRSGSSSRVLDKRLHLAPVPKAVHQVLARAHREQVDARRPQAPQDVGEAQLITGREPHHLVEPQAHEEVGRGGVIPDDH